MRELRDLRAPGETEARQRAWKLAAAAAPAAAPARRRRGPLVAAAATLALLAAAVTPTGSALADWVGDAVKSVVDGDPPPRSASGLDDLPGGGRLLVIADGSARIGRRELAAADHATWSPHGRFVAVARGNELRAVDPEGEPRWSLPTPAPVEHVSWSPDGFRIAYATATEMRLVAGDGTGDRLVTRRVVRGSGRAFGGLAWRPGTPEHVLAYTDRERVWVVNTDRRRVVWSARAEGGQLAFSPDGRRLLVLGARDVRVLGAANGRELARVGGTFGDATWTRDGRLALTRRSGPRTEVVVATPGGKVRRLFAAGGLRLGGLSPDGRWLLVEWTETRTWLFLPLEGGRARQITDVPRRVGARRVDAIGWCCAPK